MRTLRFGGVFEVGEKVMWRGGWGEREVESATVIGEGTKNGRVVYDLDNGHWAYADQLSKIEGDL